MTLIPFALKFYILDCWAVVYQPESMVVPKFSICHTKCMVYQKQNQEQQLFCKNIDIEAGVRLIALICNLLISK